MPVIRADRVPEDDPDLVSLATAMVEEMIGLYGGDVGTWRLVPPRGSWVVLRDADGAPVGSGGLIPLDVAEPGSPEWMGELKRLYIVPSRRGEGLSKRLVSECVAMAPELGYRTLWLETGTLQPVAVALYESLGWRRIEPYGPYADEHSVCFALDLA
jgi:GNAT superfamily N-acetyltransferase